MLINYLFLSKTLNVNSLAHLRRSRKNTLQLLNGMCLHRTLEFFKCIHLNVNIEIRNKHCQHCYFTNGKEDTQGGKASFSKVTEKQGKTGIGVHLFHPVHYFLSITSPPPVCPKCTETSQLFLVLRPSVGVKPHLRQCKMPLLLG